MKNPVYIDWDYVVNYDKPKKEKLEGTVVDIRPIMTYTKKEKDKNGDLYDSPDIEEGIFKSIRTETTVKFLDCELESFCTGRDFFELILKTIGSEILDEPIVFRFEPEDEILTTDVLSKHKDMVDSIYSNHDELFNGYNSYTRNTCNPDIVTIEFDTTETFKKVLENEFKEYVPRYYFKDLFTV